MSAREAPAIDPTFYRSPAEAVAAPRRRSWPTWPPSIGPGGSRMRWAVIDVDDASADFGLAVGRAELPTMRGRASSFRLERLPQLGTHARGPRHGCRRAAAAELLLPGLRSSNIHVYDIHPDPRTPRLHKTNHRLPSWARQDRLLPPAHPALRPGWVSSCPAWVAANGADWPGRDRIARPRPPSMCCGPGSGIAGPQYLAYDAWWHLTQNTLITSEWGTPSMIEGGYRPRSVAGRQVRPSAAFLGPGPIGRPSAGHRLGRGTADGAGAAPGP